MSSSSNDGYCSCEDISESAKVKCFVDHYERFWIHRGNPLTFSQLKHLRSVDRLSELDLGEVVCADISEEIANTLILQSFLEDYSSRHVSFAREIRASNFKTKIEFFNAI
jgi:hypothetical protein